MSVELDCPGSLESRSAFSSSRLAAPSLVFCWALQIKAMLTRGEDRKKSTVDERVPPPRKDNGSIARFPRPNQIFSWRAKRVPTITAQNRFWGYHFGMQKSKSKIIGGLNHGSPC